MTHLGQNSAAAAAAHGHLVVCFDPDPDIVRRLEAGERLVTEPGLDELVADHRSSLTYTSRVADLGRCDVVVLSTDVPTNDRGESDLVPIRSLIEQVSRSLAEHALLVILCQVPPGFTRALELPKERLFYQVETLIFGRAVDRAMHPERFIVGCADPAAPLPLPYRTYLESFGCPILPMRYESAELAKISINCFLVASVTVTNTLADLCERVGAAWHEIAPALKLDRRIGPHAYLSPGLGLSGGNLERDLATVMTLAESTGAEVSVIESFQRNSRYRKDWALRTLHRELFSKKLNPHLGVLGLAYKENTHSTKNSPSLALIEHLGDCRLTVYDPVVPATAVNRPGVQAASCMLDVARGVDALVLMTPWPEFRSLAPRGLADVMEGRTIVDPYRLLDPAACGEAGLSHFSLGCPLPRPLEH